MMNILEQTLPQSVCLWPWATDEGDVPESMKRRRNVSFSS
jgi:hypothetical protein